MIKVKVGAGPLLRIIARGLEQGCEKVTYETMSGFTESMGPKRVDIVIKLIDKDHK